MIHHANPDFWACYHGLPLDVRKLADKAFALLQRNPRHPSLHFKKLGNHWSARVGAHYRALAIPIANGFLWFWIGTHAEYDKIAG